jgi:hypothetical protein
MANKYVVTSGAVFALVAILQALRAVEQIPRNRRQFRGAGSRVLGSGDRRSCSGAVGIQVKELSVWRTTKRSRPTSRLSAGVRPVRISSTRESADGLAHRGRDEVEITSLDRYWEWPVLRRPSMAGFQLFTEVATASHRPGFPLESDQQPVPGKKYKKYCRH